MTAKTQMSSTNTLYVSGVWLLGALSHVLFLKPFGSWYDGLAHYMGFAAATLGMTFVFLISTMTAISAEAYFGLRSSLSRIITHIVTGLLIVPLGVMAILVVSPVSLATNVTLILVATEVFFALVVWSVVLISGGLIWESRRKRR